MRSVYSPKEDFAVLESPHLVLVSGRPIVQQKSVWKLELPGNYVKKTRIVSEYTALRTQSVYAVCKAPRQLCKSNTLITLICFFLVSEALHCTIFQLKLANFVSTGSSIRFHISTDGSHRRTGFAAEVIMMMKRRMMMMMMMTVRMCF